MGSFRGLFKRKYIEVPAVNDITFSINAGERVGFIGPNGAGKTTTMKMLSGLIRPSLGDVQVLGFEPHKREYDYLKQISLVMGQKAQLLWDLPPMNVFSLNKAIYGISDNDYEERLSNLIELLEVKDVVDVQTRKLSLGQRMKCELLASLLHNPKVLFLDEPTIGLDIVIQKKIRAFLKTYNKEFNTTIMLTSHYMDDVRELCNRLIIINKGELIFDGAIDTLIKEYARSKYLKIIFEKHANQGLR